MEEHSFVLGMVGAWVERVAEALERIATSNFEVAKSNIEVARIITASHAEDARLWREFCQKESDMIALEKKAQLNSERLLIEAADKAGAQRSSTARQAVEAYLRSADHVLEELEPKP